MATLRPPYLSWCHYLRQGQHYWSLQWSAESSNLVGMMRTSFDIYAIVQTPGSKRPKVITVSTFSLNPYRKRESGTIRVKYRAGAVERLVYQRTQGFRRSKQCADTSNWSKTSPVRVADQCSHRPDVSHKMVMVHSLALVAPLDAQSSAATLLCAIYHA